MDISSEHIISSFDSSSLYNTSKVMSKSNDTSKSDISKDADSQLKVKNSEKRVEISSKQNENKVRNAGVDNAKVPEFDKGTDQEENTTLVSKDNSEVKNESKKIALSNNTFLQFELEESIDEVTNVRTRKLVVYLRDKETGEVLRRVPPEEYVDLYKNKLQRGVFIDQET